MDDGTRPGCKQAGSNEAAAGTSEQLNNKAGSVTTPGSFLLLVGRFHFMLISIIVLMIILWFVFNLTE